MACWPWPRSPHATRPRWRSGVRCHRRVARHLSAPRALPDLPQQLAVAAAAAASHPELNDITITPEAAVDLQVRIPPRTARPPPTSFPQGTPFHPHATAGTAALPSLRGAQVVEDIPQLAARDVPSLLRQRSTCRCAPSRPEPPARRPPALVLSAPSLRCSSQCAADVLTFAAPAQLPLMLGEGAGWMSWPSA